MLFIPALTLAHGKESAALLKGGRIGENSESMVKRLVKSGSKLQAGLALAVAALVACSLPSEAAASGLSFRRHKPTADAAPQNKSPAPSQPPAFSIPVEPLGFYAPGAFYLGQRESLVSLDFLDEDRLLFTFRAPGLIHRADPGDDQERQIRAEVLKLPQGGIETEALWTLHDHERYLWMLHDGRFLLRDADTIKEGNARLELRSHLEFPGPLLSMEMDPGQQYLVTNSYEPPDKRPQNDEIANPPTAQADVATDDPSGDNPNAAEQRNIVLRILRRSSGQVMLVSHVRSLVHLPINSDGYMETLRGSNRDWVLNLNYFTGGSRILGKLDSSCQPPIEFASRDEVLVNTCLPQNGRKLVAMSTEGQKMWDAPSPPTQIWPILVVAPNGSRLARETLTLDHSIEDFGHPLDAVDIKGQWVEVYDAIGGKLALKAPASPILDGGGNVAISPSGKRVAVLNGSAIDVYELPEIMPPPSVATVPTQ